jgi:glycosyltransferase involved in cell wall biosynthesis
MKKIEVIISCSVKFHAFNLAEQLDKHGMLAQLYTSYSSIKNPLAKYLVSRRDKENIPENKISTFLLIAVGLKVYKNPYFWNELFDRWVAWKIKRSKATVFIGWSGMSLHSLRAAKKKGMTTILERGSSHISFQKKILTDEYANVNQEFHFNDKVEKKELIEYQEADYISIPSQFVYDSFINYGINAQKLIKNNYGASNLFSITSETKKHSKFIIIYLGALMVRKGLTYLFQALKQLDIPEDAYEVWFIGDILKELKLEIESSRKENWKFKGHIPQHELLELLSHGDVGIAPSLEEGLSMVIPQQLKCGIPVIASSNTGGADIIINEKSGFIVPIRNPQAIVEKIQFLYYNPEKLSEMKHFIANNPIDLSWDAYGERYRAAILNIFNSKVCL